MTGDHIWDGAAKLAEPVPANHRSAIHPSNAVQDQDPDAGKLVKKAGFGDPVMGALAIMRFGFPTFACGRKV